MKTVVARQPHTGKVNGQAFGDSPRQFRMHRVVEARAKLRRGPALDVANAYGLDVPNTAFPDLIRDQAGRQIERDQFKRN
ncbi:MAG TPA: hypothetical protein VHN20_07690 [Beijerinckiaceae bacterium]|nr:hypothetical protein [Beijerinckiaceae bacterium]